MEALKPARVVGAAIDEENKSAIAVVQDDSFSLAIGRRGVNVRLAVKLTGYNIDVKTETQAIEEGLEFVSLEEATAEENALKAEQIMLKKASEEAAVQPSVLRGLPEGYVAPQDRVYEEEQAEENADLTEALENEAEKKEAFIEPVKEEEPVVEAKAEEPTPEEAPEAKEVEKEEEHKEVKTTTSIEALEKSLADESSRKANKGAKKTSKKSTKKSDDEPEDGGKTLVPTGERMSIYTEEELRQMEEEEKEAEDDIDDEDIDYDDYDEYYDDDGR